MKRIIFLSDVLFHSPKINYVYHRWVIDLVEPAIKCVTNKKVENFIDLKNTKGEIFDRNYFFRLSNIYNVSDTYFPYNINLINEESWKYFFSFINKDDFILGVELGVDLRNILTSKNITYINFWFHSYHLFDDTCFMLNTNKEDIYKKINLYKIVPEKFELYAYITKQLLKKSAEQLNIDDNCCLFIGQTFKDKSVEKDGVFLNISYFGKRLDQLSKKYSTVYYIPHPFVAQLNNEQIDSFLKERPYIKILENVPTYTLLSSPKVSKVVGISSSVLYEAQFFGKEIEYFYQPLFNIDTGNFGLNEFVSVYNDYLNPKFWSDVFAKHFIINSKNKDIIIYDRRTSLIREIADSYHGYRWIDNNKRILDKIDNLQSQIDNIINNTSNLAQKNFISRIYKKVSTEDLEIRYFYGIPFLKVAKKQGTTRIYFLGLLVLNIERA